MAEVIWTTGAGSSDEALLRKERGRSIRALLDEFQIIRKLGEGTFGQVFHVRHRREGYTCALKLLKENMPKEQELFRYEFQMMQRVHHANLVALHQFVQQDGCTYYTMELVEGVPFDVYIQRGYQEQEYLMSQLSDRQLSWLVEDAERKLQQRGQDAPQTGGEHTITLGTESLHNVEKYLPSQLSSGSSSDFSRGQEFGEHSSHSFDVRDEGRLRHVLAQLVEGVSALHAAGILHRDLKPSNVFVTEEGQVKILDFGLAHLEEEGSPSELRQAGTPAYMPPPREPLSEASDWYNVGVMLFQALTGQLPFQGSAVEILKQKASLDPPSPEQLTTGLPSDLIAACHGLLQRDPDKRFSEVALRECLHLEQRRSVRSIFVGRRREIDHLDGAFLQLKQGHPSVMCVKGASGVGKSALAQHFLRRLRALEREPYQVFSVHCFEQENLPYRAISGLIDLLCRHLRTASSVERNALLRAYRSELLLVFPVFGQIKEMGTVEEARYATKDIHLQELRSRAFTGLHDLILHLAMERHIVLYLDDLQWLDEESAELLEALMKPPQTPRLLLLLSYRSEDASAHEPLARLMQVLQSYGPDLLVDEMELQPLAPGDARQLAEGLLASSESSLSLEPSRLSRLFEDAEGSPLLLTTFLKHIIHNAEQPEQSDAAINEYTRDATFEALLSQFHDASRELLDFLAIARQPMSLRLVGQLLGNKQMWREELPRLRSGFLRVLMHGKRRAFALYHSQLREYLLQSMTKTRRAGLHERIARALPEVREADPVRLAYHFRGAGGVAEAQAALLLAAEKAFETMAFRHAARMLEQALESGEALPAQQRSDLLERLAEAHEYSGFSRKAALAYQQASRQASGANALALRQKAAEQLLCCGSIDEALASFQQIFDALGMAFPDTPWAAEPMILWHRLLLRWQWWRRQGPAEGSERLPVSSSELEARAHASYALSLIFGHIDPVRAIYFQVLFLRCGLLLSTPRERALTWIIEGLYRSLQDEGGALRHVLLIEEGINLAKRSDEPLVVATARAVLGFVDFIQGRWRRALQHFDACEAQVRAGRVYVWEKSAAVVYRVNCLIFMGDFARVEEILDEAIALAKQRGDRFTETFLRWGVETRLALAQDDVSRAHDAIVSADQGWTHSRFDLQRYIEMLVRAETHLYLGDPESAEEVLESRRSKIKALRLWHSPFHQIELHNIYGRVWLAQLCHPQTTPRRRQALVAHIASACRKIDRLFSWGGGLARLLRAGVASLDGRRDEAAAELIAAETRFEALDMMLHAHVAGCCLGALQGGDAGASRLQQAAEAMHRLGIANVGAMVRMLAPGAWLHDVEQGVAALPASSASSASSASMPMVSTKHAFTTA